MASPDDKRPPAARSAIVVCSKCHARIDLSVPLPREGWQQVHVCPGQCIEAMAWRAGEPAWTWKARAECG